MLITTSKIERSRVIARDGAIGRVDTFLFDEEQWVVRYLVVRHGLPLLRKHALLSVASVKGPAGADGSQIKVDLTREEVKHAPSADLARPVSRRKEEQFHRYYKIPVYWGGSGLWGSAMTPMEAGTVTYEPESQTEPIGAREDEYHLRSTREVEGYRVETAGADAGDEGVRDNEVGIVGGFLIEDAPWAVRYLRIDPHESLGGGHLYVSPHWVGAFSWIESKMTLEMQSPRLREIPTFGVQETLSRDDEEQLHAFFERAGYWEEESQ